MLHKIKTRWTRFLYVALEVVVALCLAFLVWRCTHSRTSDSTEFVQVPVQLQVPPKQREHSVLESQGPTRVTGE